MGKEADQFVGRWVLQDSSLCSLQVSRLAGSSHAPSRLTILEHTGLSLNWNPTKQASEENPERELQMGHPPYASCALTPIVALAFLCAVPSHTG